MIILCESKQNYLFTLCLFCEYVHEAAEGGHAHRGDSPWGFVFDYSDRSGIVRCTLTDGWRCLIDFLPIKIVSRRCSGFKWFRVLNWLKGINVYSTSGRNNIVGTPVTER